jgi:hypothetical protein
VEAVAKYTEKQMASVSAGFGLDLGTIRGAVNNACRILEVSSAPLNPELLISLSFLALSEFTETSVLHDIHFAYSLYIFPFMF